MTSTETRAHGLEDRPRPADELSDSQLLGRFREGSQEAALQLYLRYARRLRALARVKCASGLAKHVDAEDIVQSVFGTFFRGVSCGRYDITEGDDLWKLFLVLTLNKVRAEGIFHLAAKRDARLTFALDRLPASVRLKRQPRGTAQGLSKLVVEEALELLPPQHRSIVELRTEGHQVAEIAQQLGRSKRSIERILQESRHKLSAVLQEP
jgi:RNA polymerase sigma-70 factor (ECF subfamily)